MRTQRPSPPEPSLVPTDIEVLAVGVAPEATLEERGGRLCGVRPGPVGLMRISMQMRPTSSDSLARPCSTTPPPRASRSSAPSTPSSRRPSSPRWRRCRAQLVAAGVTTGEAVAVQLPSGPGMAAGMFGVWLAGAVFVPVNSRQPPREVDHVVQAIRPAAFLDDTGLRRLDAASEWQRPRRRHPRPRPRPPVTNPTPRSSPGPRARPDRRNRSCRRIWAIERSWVGSSRPSAKDPQRRRQDPDRTKPRPGVARPQRGHLQPPLRLHGRRTGRTDGAVRSP